ncbi:MAG: hypothetical protein ABIH39_05725 [Candidatus Margulisiibacteriota bacterium]
MPDIIMNNLNWIAIGFGILIIFSVIQRYKVTSVIKLFIFLVILIGSAVFVFNMTNDKSSKITIKKVRTFFRKTLSLNTDAIKKEKQVKKMFEDIKDIKAALSETQKSIGKKGDIQLRGDGEKPSYEELINALDIPEAEKIEAMKKLGQYDNKQQKTTWKRRNREQLD